MPKRKDMIKKPETRLVSLITVNICEKITREKFSELMGDMEYSTLTGKMNVFNNWSFSEVEKIIMIAKDYQIDYSSISEVIKKYDIKE